MNANYETVVSLIELLVKKAGFDLSKDYSEIELEKTKKSIKELVKERNSTNDKKAINALIENLKVRQANWENNAEMVGKSLLKAYEEGKDYNTVKMRIELLANLAMKGTDNISVGSVYGKIKSLDSEYQSLQEKIDNTDYRNIEEKEMDLRYKTYLENKIASIDSELESLTKELESLRDVELKDVGIVSKIKEYIEKLTLDKKKIDKVFSTSMSSDIAFDVWERLETAKHNTDEKLSKAKELLSKTEEMLEDVNKNRNNINDRKTVLETEKTRCNTKLNNINTKLENDDYINNTDRMIDVNSSELMRLELESLKNKKDVIYVDVGKVKEELIKAWGKERPPIIKEKLKKEINEKREEIQELIEELETSQNDSKPKDEVQDIEILDEGIIDTKESVSDEVKPEVVKEEIKKEPLNVEAIEEELKDIEKELEDKTIANIFEENKVNTTEKVIKPKEEVSENKILETPVKETSKEDKEVETALDNIDELIEKSEKAMKDLSKVVGEHLQDEAQNVEVRPKTLVKEKKNKIELDW